MIPVMYPVCMPVCVRSSPLVSLNQYYYPVISIVIYTLCHGPDALSSLKDVPVLYTRSRSSAQRDYRERDSVTSNPKLDLNPAVGRRAHW